MKRKILIYYIVLVVIAISVAGMFISELAQRIYKDEVEQRLKTTAALIDYDLSGKLEKGEKVDFNQAAIEYAKILSQSLTSHSAMEGIEARVTFIDYTGKVIGESASDYLTMENHLNRKEIKTAIAGGVGEDIRSSRTLHIDFFYVAVPMKATRTVARVSLPLIQIKKIDETIIFYTVVGILAGILITILLALKFSSSITYPVTELIKASREFTRGNYSKRANVKSRDEFGQLAETFNELATELERTVSDLTDKNLRFDSIMNSMINGIVAVDDKYRVILINSIACSFFGIDNEETVIGKNILEVIRNNQINSFIRDTVENGTPILHEITTGTAEERIFRVYTTPIKSRDGQSGYSGGILSLHEITTIKKLEQIRTEFVSNVTHELKTPLTSIRGFVETLRSGAVNDPDVADKFLEIIDIEAERLYMLINDILQLSEIESGKKDTNIGMYPLRPIVDEVVSILQGTADKKQITLHMDVDAGIRVMANRNRIKQMLINLIDNGIKYNTEGGSVYVTAHKEAGRIVILVRDTGIGIAQQHLPRIFERFYRVDKGRSRSMGGTGLGLSIVKHIVNLYNGDIKVESEPGKGTEFIIQLPS